MTLVPVSDYTPTVDRIGSILRARTKTRGGAEIGTFSPADAAETLQTRPTYEQVEEQIAMALEAVETTFGADVDSACQRGARRVAEIGAAMGVELSYFPEQVATGRSPYAQLEKRYEDAWANLLTCTGQGEPGGEHAPGAGSPSYGGFPTSGIGMETPW